MVDHLDLLLYHRHAPGKAVMFPHFPSQLRNLRLHNRLGDLLFLFTPSCCCQASRHNTDKGQSPGDTDGGEIYEFVLTEGDYPGFTYVINGPNDCYLLIEGEWFVVTNPTNPPIE